MTLSQLIEAKKFDWINDNITEGRFPVVAVPTDTEYKLFQFDHYISSKDAIQKIESEGWRPANISELLAYDWDGKDMVVALGSVAKVAGARRVPCLDKFGSKRRLCLSWWSDDWRPAFRFLAVRNSQTLEKVDIGTSDALALRVEKIEKILKHHNLTEI